ncbi:MAG: fumarylacetoacetate hydrolase family protein [Fibrella sp.]|nr:fumarylacetoacetate hydrolase family protein [Armatimonadota bacterium]
MKIAYLEIDGVRTVAMAHTDGNLYSIPRLLALSGAGIPVPGTVLDAAADGTALANAVSNAIASLTMSGDTEQAIVPSASRLLAPLPRPNRILAIGRNYAEHAKEQGASVTEEPIVFLKASQSVIAPDEAIRIPEGIGRVDFEAELMVVLGSGGKNIVEADAMSHVAGYTVFNDVTARTMQKKAQSSNHPWFLSKSLDTFGPMGPYLITPDEVPDPHDLRISLTVNGEPKQDDTTASMVFRIPFLIAYLSRFFALEPGDVIATGTPSGIGAIVPGDIVSVVVEGIGTLSNPVEAA